MSVANLVGNLLAEIQDLLAEYEDKLAIGTL